MLDAVDLTMLNDIEAIDPAAEFYSKTLEAETDAEDGSEKIVGDVPDVFDNTDVPGYVWRARSGADDYGVEVGEQRKEGGYGQDIVFDDMDVGSRYGPLTERG